MNLDWLMPLIGAIGACIAFFFSKPKRLWLVFIAVFCLTFAASWDASNKYRDLQTKREIRNSVHKKLIKSTDSFLDFLSEMIFCSSGGYLPRTEDEFFSSQIASMICKELNISLPDPLNISEETWRNLIHHVFKRYENVLRSSLDKSALFLDSDLIKAIDDVSSCYLLRIGKQLNFLYQVDKELGIEREPVLCWGFEPLVEESLSQIHTLFLILKKYEKEVEFTPTRDWLVFPQPHLKEYFGKSRFSPADLKAWREKHPDSPGPAKFGAGNPNKQCDSCKQQSNKPIK
jgi:hypothetical protein